LDARSVLELELVAVLDDERLPLPIVCTSSDTRPVAACT
jgi:hypothetical protein